MHVNLTRFYCKFVGSDKKTAFIQDYPLNGKYLVISVQSAWVIGAVSEAEATFSERITPSSAVQKFLEPLLFQERGVAVAA
jgi:hypothetical protein